MNLAASQLEPLPPLRLAEAEPDVRFADRTREPTLIERALEKIESILTDRVEREELQSRIVALETEIDLLRRRDAALRATMHQLDEEQRLAARIQRDFLPKTIPTIAGVTFHVVFRPAHYVSGDLYDIRRLDEHHIGVYLADAVGHGMPAALLTMFMKNALVTKRIIGDHYELLEPVDTLRHLNCALRSQNLNHSAFATAVYARIDCTRREVCFARGGHPHPLLIKPTGQVIDLETDGTLLGVFDSADATWSQGCVRLEPGDRLLIYSDGIESLFATDSTPDPVRWRAELASRADRSSPQILSDFVAALDQQSGGPKDDVTLILADAA